MYFPYPKYCHKESEQGKDATADKKGLGNETSSSMKQGASFLKTNNWASKPFLRAFQKV